MRQLSTASTAAHAREGIGPPACSRYRGQCSRRSFCEVHLASQHGVERAAPGRSRPAAFADFGRKTSVEDRLACPRYVLSCRMNTLSSSRCVAKLCRRVGQFAFVLSPPAESAIRGRSAPPTRSWPRGTRPLREKANRCDPSSRPRRLERPTDCCDGSSNIGAAAAPSHN